MTMMPFYVGQRVVAVRGHESGVFNKGDEFVVSEIQKSPCKCCCWMIRIGNILGDGIGSHCGRCDTRISYDGPLWFAASRFAPVEAAFQSVSFERVAEGELCSVN